jgi:hypothetical protein
MAEIMKRTADPLQPELDRDVFTWDSEFRASAFGWFVSSAASVSRRSSRT